MAFYSLQFQCAVTEACANLPADQILNDLQSISSDESKRESVYFKYGVYLPSTHKRQEASGEQKGKDEVVLGMRDMSQLKSHLDEFDEKEL